jgi:uncharacterized protein YndB with AHSA1/START domain
VADTTDNGSYRVERTIDIAAPAESIFGYLVDFHRWTAWSPWEDLDPNLTRWYTGAESGVGAIYEWAGLRKAGQGRMEIREVSAPSAVTIQLDFLKPFKSSSTASFALVPAGDGTRVTWSMVGRKTLMTKAMGVFMSMDKMVGPDFEKGLARLKTLAES